MTCIHAYVYYLNGGAILSAGSGGRSCTVNLEVGRRC